MKGCVHKIGFLITLLFSAVQFIAAQSNLEFVENKGQWDKRISFRGELNIGSFALKPDGGYRMLLYNQDDLAALNAHTTKYPSATTNTKSISGNDEKMNRLPKRF